MVVFLFGGSPTASTGRLVWQLLLGFTQLAVCWLIDLSRTQVLAIYTWYYLTLLQLLVGAAVSGYLLSTSPAHLHPLGCWGRAGGRAEQERRIGGKGGAGAGSVSHAALLTQEFLTHTVLLSLTALLAAILSDPEPNPVPAPATMTTPSLGWAVLGCRIAVKTVQEAQKVFMLCGVVRSPLYSR